MTDTQRVTDEQLHEDIVAYGGRAGTAWIARRAQDCLDARALAQSQAATIAELRAEVERTREVLAGTDAGSLPNDMPLSRIAEKRMDERYKYFWQVKDTCTRAEAAESALATANAKIEKLKAALRDVEEGLVFRTDHQHLLDALRDATEDAPHG